MRFEQKTALHKRHFARPEKHSPAISKSRTPVRHSASLCVTKVALRKTHFGKGSTFRGCATSLRTFARLFLRAQPIPSLPDDSVPPCKRHRERIPLGVPVPPVMSRL